MTRILVSIPDDLHSLLRELAVRHRTSMSKLILAAVEEVAKSGKEMNRSNVRDAIQNSHVNTLQGAVAFDQNGDILDRTVSVFQYRHDDKYPPDDITHQLKYLEAAPQS